MLVSSNAQLKPPQNTMPAAKSATAVQGPMRHTQAGIHRFQPRRLTSKSFAMVDSIAPA